MKQNHYFHIKYAPGRGTNNREKFIALWSLFEATLRKGARKLHVMGDSKMIIDWENKKAMLSDVCLGPLLQDC
jgi:hypothetical protein